MDIIVIIKVISKLIYPLGLSFVFAILAYLAYWREHTKIANCLLVFATTILLLASNSWVAVRLASSLEQQYPLYAINDIAQHDAIIVLGGGLRLPIPPARTAQIGSGSERYWYATQLYRAGKAPRIFLVGGNVYPQQGIHSESYYARELLHQWGVPKEIITIETQSRTTGQNYQFLAPQLKRDNINSALLVTSALHMPRSYGVFKSLPIKVTPAPTDLLVLNSSIPSVLSWLPSSEALHLTTVSMHEYYGDWFAQLKSVFE